jgi:hypothetical protein
MPRTAPSSAFSFSRRRRRVRRPQRSAATTASSRREHLDGLILLRHTADKESLARDAFMKGGYDEREALRAIGVYLLAAGRVEESDRSLREGQGSGKPCERSARCSPAGRVLHGPLAIPQAWGRQGAWDRRGQPLRRRRHPRRPRLLCGGRRQGRNEEMQRGDGGALRALSVQPSASEISKATKARSCPSRSRPTAVRSPPAARAPPSISGRRTTDSLIRTLIGHRGAVRSLSFSSDGRRLVSASEDGTVNCGDLESGKALKTFAGHAGGVSARF